MSGMILVLNAGSSSLKFGLFDVGGPGDVTVLIKGVLEGIGTNPRVVIKDAAGTVTGRRSFPSEEGDARERLLKELLEFLDRNLDAKKLLGVGHRVVHGGGEYVAATLLTDDIIRDLEDLTPLAPLHQPASLAPIKLLAALRLGLAQFACFDTAFHHGLEPPASSYPLPREYAASGIRRYGFHGLSYAYIAGRLREISPELAAKRTVVAHLGSGCSLCAMRDGKSADTTMGFTPLEGLMMGTRSGTIDPGLLLYLQQARGMSVADLEQLLYHQSGLLGVSGLSSDTRDLLDGDDPRAAEALDLFAFRTAREIAAMANTLQGLDTMVFTGGIGEHAWQIRAMICARLHWLGVELDETANREGDESVGLVASKVQVLVVPTDEELMIARQVRLAINPKVMNCGQAV